MKQELLYKLKKKKKLSNEYLLSINDCAKEIITLMKKHIGDNKKISKLQLFKQVYGVSNPMELPRLHVYYMLDIIKKALHRLRQKTRCQVICKKFGGVYFYWVANTYGDSEIYRSNLEQSVKSMRRAENRMEKSIKEKWYAYPDRWSIE